jgi:hypothetical protein
MSVTQRFMVGQDGQLVPMNGQSQGLTVPQKGGMSVPQPGGMSVHQQVQHGFLVPGQVIEIVQGFNQQSQSWAQMLSNLPEGHGFRYEEILEIYEEE